MKVEISQSELQLITLLLNMRVSEEETYYNNLLAADESRRVYELLEFHEKRLNEAHRLFHKLRKPMHTIEVEIDRPET
ncbi:MAG: hypothetical protein RI556_11570 [Hydrogenovibrio sp.]|uniref:hypothetical protein n=1 Tax=Hydrogenovibrio sp. TaxID=2065821 RepID=UPI0028707917|nr:hypothetical protein [Hydrogenovibrio sp.]MDR9499806.1 hypothetical protein [Hydrogenovibrio sp.]